MIKRILVALDLDTDTPIAIRYAISLAEKHNASVSGLAVIDTENIDHTVGVGPIGTMYYAHQLRDYLTEEAREQAGMILQKFEEMVEGSGLRHSEILGEGAPFERIVEDLKFHDLLIIGRDSHFFYNRPQKETRTLAKVVKNGSAPVMVVPPGYSHIDHITVAHDGSIAAARALQWFVQLNAFGNDMPIDLLNVYGKRDGEREEKSRLLLHLAADYLRNHGYHRISQVALPGGDTAETIIEHAAGAGSKMIILGAHSMSAIKRLTFGSVTHSLIMNAGVPLFLSA